MVKITKRVVEAADTREGPSNRGQRTAGRLFKDSPLYGVTPHVVRHSFASIANDRGPTEVTIAALVGHAKGSVTSKYIHTLDTALIMAADTISGCIQGLLDGIEFKQAAYAYDRDSRKAALALLLKRASTGGPEEEHHLAALSVTRSYDRLRSSALPRILRSQPL